MFSFTKMPTLRTWISACLFVAGVFMLGQSMYMTVKAQLAQVLIAHAWQSKPAHQPAARPWPWADIHAVAKIEVPRLGITQYVMNASNGEALAFGPGHLSQTSLPAQAGHSMVAGHRDSHFEFLQYLKPQDEIIMTNYRGQQQRYLIKRAYLLDTRTEQLWHQPEQNALTLITCYPFNKLSSQGPLRWIVETSLASKVASKVVSSVSI